MKIAVIGARGFVGKACVNELKKRDENPIPLSREDSLPENIQGVIIACPIEERDFEVPIVDCSGSLLNTTLVLPGVTSLEATRMRIPNCMASLIAQALAPLHKKSNITSLLATCMQSVSGAGWRGVRALEQKNTGELFGGELANNILPHEKYEEEERAIQNDLHELFNCKVSVTSFRVPVFVGHTASIRIETAQQIEPSLLKCNETFDPLTMENKQHVAIGRVRIQKKTADLVVCGNQLTCGTAIPAVISILRS
jgi:aspartate-semialdehyde dehydrogenase